MTVVRACAVTALAFWIALASGPPLHASRAADAGCGRALGPEEQEIARLFEGARQQRRRQVHCDPLLSRIARARAEDMARRRYFKHVNPDGDGPNRQLERAGYALPGSYSRKRSANNVEAIAAGAETPAEAWKDWITSRSHRKQVLGLDRFFEDQTDYGVGYAEVPGSRYDRYWVLITARH